MRPAEKQIILVMSVMTLMLIAMAVVCSAAETMWHETPDAPYHKACVKVRIYDRVGSGTVIAVSNEYCYVLTAGHVAQYHKECTITWLNGAKAQGTVIRSQVQPDLALLKVPHNDPDWVNIPYIPVAASYPAQGVMCEVTGYGLDGSDELRHFYATVRGYEKHGGAMTLDTSVCSGDSGGGVIVNGELVGIIQGGSYRTDFEGGSLGQGMYVWPALGPNVTQVRDFLTVSGWERICGPEGCEPLLPWGGIIKRKDPGREKPPITLPPQQPLIPVDPCKDLGGRVDALEEQLSGYSEQLETKINDTKGLLGLFSERIDLFDGKLLGIDGKFGELTTYIDIRDDKHRQEQDSAISELLAGQSHLGKYVGLASLLGLTGPAGIAVGAAGWIAVRRLRKRIQGPSTKVQEPSGTHDDLERWKNLAKSREKDYFNKTEQFVATVDGRDKHIENQRKQLDDLNKELDTQKIKTTDFENEVQELNSVNNGRIDDTRDLNEELDIRRAEVISLRDRVRTLKNAENHYVNVPVQNSEAESYKTACRQVVEKYPEAANVVQLVEGIAQQIEHGQDVIRGHKSSPLTEE